MLFNVPSTCLKFADFEIQNLEFLNEFEWSLVNTKVEVVGLSYMFVINIFLKSFRVSNISFKFKYFERNFFFIFFKQTRMELHFIPML